jgi:excisionase family DNA binding protein
MRNGMNDENLAGALTVAEFCGAFNVGRTFLYNEIKNGRLSACKAGSKTLILRCEAARWARALPKLETSNAAKVDEAGRVPSVR